MRPKVSVIIRTYNRADLVEKAIHSVLTQSFQDFEIVVADDGSSDNTKEIIEKLAAKDSRIRFISQVHFGMPGRTLNLGIKNCRGIYIALLDSDDEWLPSKLEKQVRLIESAAADVGFVACNIIIINPDGTQEEWKLSSGQSFLGSILKKNYFLSLSSILVKKDLFDFIGPVDENFKTGEDWDMFIRFAQKYDYDFVDEPLCKYYIHGSNISYGKDYSRRAIDLEYLLEKHLELYKRYPKVLEYRYSTLAFYLVNSGDMKKARIYIKKCYELNRSLKNLAKLLLSYFGKTVYLKVLTTRLSP